MIMLRAEHKTKTAKSNIENINANNAAAILCSVADMLNENARRGHWSN